MAELLLQDISEGMVQRLRERARLHGRTLEAEHRAILEQVVGPDRAGPPMTIQEFAEALRGLNWPEELDMDELRSDRDSGRATYLSPEGLDRLGRLLRPG